MRILFCNKYNYPFSGTEVYLFEVMELLRSRGHEVALFSMENPRGEQTPYDKHFVSHIDFKGRRGFGQKLRQAAHAIYSTEARTKLRRMIQEFQPDVAHVRNIYHHLSPSILWELKAQCVPVLNHLNDFKILCPAYNFVSQGETCEACKTGAFWHAMNPKCYPGLGARGTLVAEAYVHRWMDTYRKCVDLFLAPSRFVRDKFVESGWDASRFEVLPHFQTVPQCQPESRTSSLIFYFGRLSAEKGTADLVRAMERVPELRLAIAGDGPQRGELEQLAAKLRLENVRFLGQIGAAERDRWIVKSTFTVMPSHAYETLGKTILESYAQGRAVVASDRGSRRELVRHGETGLLYRCGSADDLVCCLKRLAAHPEEAQRMGRNGYDWVRADFRPEAHYEKLLGVYERLRSKRTAAKKPLVTVLRTESAGSTSPRLRVAFIGGRGVISKYSGIETYYEEVGSRLAAMGHEVTVYCRNYFTPAIAEHNGLRLVRLPTLRSKHFETVIHTALSTAHALTRRYDVIHYHALGPSLFSLIPRMFGTKTAVTVQGLDWQRKKWGRIAASVLRLGEKASAALPNCTMVVSRVLEQHYRSRHHVDSVYIPNGGLLRERSIPRKIFEWGLEPGKYVLFLGRFSPEKGCHVLVNAFEQLDTDTKLVMAGASSYCDEYSRELRTHASDRIRMLDWVSGDDLDELLTNAMTFILPSDMEGLSLALLDAMGAGLCVLTSDVPENREAVEGAGFTFRCGSAEHLADRLRFLIANPAIREAAGKAARQRVEQQYQWSMIARDIERTYFQIAGKDAAPELKKPSARVELAESGQEPKRRVG